MRINLPTPAKPDVKLPILATEVPYPAHCQCAQLGACRVEVTRASQSPCAAAGSPTGHLHAQIHKESFNPVRRQDEGNPWVFL